MKPETKKWIIVGGLGVISVFLAAAYLQYKKLMNYTIKVKGVKLNKLNAKTINFDLFINFTNNSDLKFVIIQQEYKVYMNGKFLSQLSGNIPTTINAKSTSLMPINVNFNPIDVAKLLGKNALSILASPEKIEVKIDSKFKVKMFGIKVSIPYVYDTTLKELISPTPLPE